MINVKRLAGFIVIALFISLVITKVIFFNDFGTDDGIFADVSLSILKGRLNCPLYGNLLESNRYFFIYPPLHMVLTAAIFKLFGATYLTSKFVSVFFALFLSILTLFYCRYRLGNSLGILVCALIIFDPLFFDFVYYNNRPDAIATFFFTLAVLLFLEAKRINSVRLIFLSGISSGLAMLSSYQCHWLFVSFLLYAFYLIRHQGFERSIKELSLFLFAFFITMGPWYMWIMVDKLRRQIFSVQILNHLGNAQGNQYSLNQIFNKLLNPFADLYVAIFRHHSPYSLIILLVLAYMVFQFRKYVYSFLLLLVSLFMMVFTQRAAHYFVIMLPICYINFGFILKDILYKKYFNQNLRRIILIVVALLVFAEVVNSFRKVFSLPTVSLDAEFYTTFLKENTSDASRIATDPVFVLAGRGDRKIIDVGILIWKFFRKSFKDYNEIITKAVNADYIILTERKKRWGELPIDQNIEFQNYLKRCTLLKVVNDHNHRPLWIYQPNNKR